MRRTAIALFSAGLVLPACALESPDEDSAAVQLAASGSGTGSGEGSGEGSGSGSGSTCSASATQGSNTFTNNGNTVNVTSSTGSSSALLGLSGHDSIYASLTYTARVYDPRGNLVFTYTGPANGTGSNTMTLVQSSQSATNPQPGKAYDEGSFGFEAELAYEESVAMVQGLDYFDNQGCDSPAGGISCTQEGFCCDDHDQCYAQNNCTASSWYNPFASQACKDCNSQVVACIAATKAYNACASTPIGGPSSCCDLGTCGSGWSSCCSGPNCQCMLSGSGTPCTPGTSCPGATIQSGNSCPPCPTDGGTDSSDAGPETGSDSGSGSGSGSGVGSGSGSGSGG